MKNIRRKKRSTIQKAVRIQQEQKNQEKNLHQVRSLIPAEKNSQTNEKISAVTMKNTQMEIKVDKKRDIEKNLLAAKKNGVVIERKIKINTVVTNL